MTPADQRIADLRDGIRAEAEALRDRAVKLDEAADHLDVALTIAVDDTTAHLPEPKPKPEPTAGGKRKRTRRSKSPASRRTSPATEAPGKKKKPQGGHAGVTQLAILAHLGDCVGAWRRPADIGRAIDRPGALVAGALRRMHNRGEPRLQLQRLGPRSCQYRLAPEGEESDPDPEPEAVPPPSGAAETKPRATA